ncbi:MAG: oxaloacetate decarboxylase [Candidatus Binatia bacterium]
MSQSAAPGAQLRNLMARPEGVVAPGAFDTLSARAVQASGFDAVYMTGFGTSASLLGLPDLGFVSLSEMVERARRIVFAVSVPVVADADTGYGNALNIYRTVREYENAGVAGIHLEDQVFPKKCGHMEGKRVISGEEHAEKIRAACEARRDPSFVIIARTDARAVLGLDEAIRRGRLYQEAGADVLFIEAPMSEAEMTEISRSLPGIPLLANMTERGKTPILTPQALAALNYKLTLWPLTALLAATQAMLRTLTTLRKEGSSAQALDGSMAFAEFNRFIGLEEWQARERRYIDGDAGV